MKQFYLKLSSLTVAVLMALLLVFSSMPVLAANENPAESIEIPGAFKNKATIYLGVGETKTITYVLKDGNGDITTDPNASVTPKIEREEPDSGSGSVISQQDLGTFVVKGLAVGYANIRIDMETTENLRGTQWIDVYVANQNPESVKASTDSITLNLKTGEDYPVRNFFNGIAAVGEEDASFCDLTFSVADPSIAKVSDASPYWLTPLAVGSTTLTATARNGKSATVDLLVVNENLAEDITVKGNPEGMRVADISMKFGTDITLEYTLLPEGGNFSDEIVTWSVFAGDDVVEVDQNGKVTPKKSGSAQVKATTKLGDYAHWNIEVVDGEFAYGIEAIDADGLPSGWARIDLTEGSTEKLKYVLYANAGTSDEKLTWSIESESDQGVVSLLDQDGTIQVNKGGFAVVKATTVLGWEARWSITSKDIIDVIKFDPNKSYFLVHKGLIGSGMIYSKLIGSEDITNPYTSIGLKSSNPDVIEIIPNGDAAVRGIGTTIITAFSKDGTKSDSDSDSHVFEVIDCPLIEFHVDDVTLIEGQNMEPSEDWNGNAFDKYNILDELEYTIVYDWETYTGDYEYIKGKLTELLDFFPGFNLYDHQISEDTVIKEGETRQASIDFLGFADTFNVTVVPASAPAKYTVTWKDYDGTVLSTETYSKGETPEYKGTEPARTATGTNVYIFKEWMPEIEAVTADAEYTAKYEEIKPEVAEPVVEVTGTISDEDKKILEDSLKKADALGVDSETLVEAIDTEAVQQQILDKNIDPETVSIETKFEIKAQEVNKDASSGQISLTLDITPKCVISYSENGATKTLEEPIKISKPVSMKVPVGTLFGTAEETKDGTPVFVVHKQAIYNGKLVTDGTERYVEFENPHGFSEFTFTTEDPAIIKIGEEGYLTLQDAVDAVKDGGTITIVKAAEKEALKATVSKEISFTVSISDGAELAKEDISLTAGDGYEMSVSKDKYTFTEKEEPEPEYIPAEADYSKVDAALKKAEELDRELYTEESLKAVDDAAAAVTRGLYDYEQAKVDAMATAIEDALAALEEKEPEKTDDTPADYSTVHDAIAKIPADLSIYTDESVAALEAALAGIEEGLTADQQSKVDEMAAALESAIAGLKEKDQPQPEPQPEPEPEPEPQPEPQPQPSELINGWRYNAETGHWYYYEDSVTLKNQWKQDTDGTWYYLLEDGAMADSRWLQINNVWYYFKADGAMADSGWLKISNVWYFFKGSGAMAANEWIGGYWLSASGAWTYNAIGVWKQNSIGWWFEDTYGWYPVNTTVRIDYIDYTFNAAGYWVP